jgi:transcriptional regulator with XRE-family HTH domain
MSSFGDKLKKLRETANMTQSDLASKLDVTQRFVSYYEKGKSIPTDPNVLNKLVSIFNVTLDYLLLDKESDNPDESESKLHRVIKRLTEKTTEKTLTWLRLSEFDNTMEEAVTIERFLSTLPSYQYAVIDREQSYIYWRYDEVHAGGYIITKINFPDAPTEQSFDIALLVDYNNQIHYMTNTKNIQTLDDLYFAIVSANAGIDQFIDDFLNEDEKQSSSKAGSWGDEEIPF